MQFSLPGDGHSYNGPVNHSFLGKKGTDQDAIFIRKIRAQAGMALHVHEKAADIVLPLFRSLFRNFHIVIAVMLN